ncbi:ArsR/SmtB family transcription factor [Cellulomonas endophytica]|uniref:ArsR/SmtB family transcription factor n=1 Tax=Cellulomonas endophytica TaxID=2494735 RepID=UPI00101227BB|nr:metalloregulator ArsR/SmtB family transcription factor [Cellulomonas endophytica]
MTTTRPVPTGRGALAPAGALFRGLGDLTRLALVQRLAASPARVVDLAADLQLAPSTVSSHLACLRECGLIDFRAQGRASVYYLPHPELIGLLVAAEAVLAATGSAVVLCPQFGTQSVAMDAR